MRDARTRLNDMLQAIERIEARMPLTEAEFRADEMSHVFALFHLMIVGEAANRRPRDITDRYHGIPWKDISGLRHVVVHGYFATDLAIVWGIIQRDLPALKLQLERILADLSP